MKTHKVTSDNKDSAYIATVLLFQNVQRMSSAGIGNWKLTSTYTNSSEKHFITEYQNGKMFISAESIDDERTYSFGEI